MRKLQRELRSGNLVAYRGEVHRVLYIRKTKFILQNQNGDTNRVSRMVEAIELTRESAEWFGFFGLMLGQYRLKFTEDRIYLMRGEKKLCWVDSVHDLQNAYSFYNHDKELDYDLERVNSLFGK